MKKIAILIALFLMPTIVLADATITTSFTSTGTSTYRSRTTTSSGTLIQNLNNQGFVSINSFTNIAPTTTVTTGVLAVGRGNYKASMTPSWGYIRPKWKRATVGIASYVLP